MKNKTRQQFRCRVWRFRISPEGKDARSLYAGFKLCLFQGAKINIKWNGNFFILVFAIVRLRWPHGRLLFGTLFEKLNGRRLPRTKSFVLSAYNYGTQSGSGDNLKGCSSDHSSLTMLRR